MKTGKDLKELYMKYNNLSSEIHKIRFFNKGFEILDEHKLCTHKISKETNVQVVVKELES